MRKIFIFILFIFCAAFTLAQSSQLDISYENRRLKLDNETKHEIQVFDLSLIRLNITTKQTLHIEDFKIEINNEFQEIGEKIQFIEINPSENKIEKTYQLIFKQENDKNKVEIDFFIKHQAFNHSIKILFYSNNNSLDISMIWKAPIQANKEEKTGIETVLPKYVVNLEISSSEPLLERDFRMLLNGIYQENKVLPRRTKAKAIIGNDGKTIYQYDYICEIELFEGINKIKLEVSTKHYVPRQEKFYSSVLYLNKVKE